MGIGAFNLARTGAYREVSGHVPVKGPSGRPHGVGWSQLAGPLRAELVLSSTVTVASNWLATITSSTPFSSRSFTATADGPGPVK